MLYTLIPLTLNRTHIKYQISPYIVYEHILLVCYFITNYVQTNIFFGHSLVIQVDFTWQFSFVFVLFFKLNR